MKIVFGIIILKYLYSKKRSLGKLMTTHLFDKVRGMGYVSQRSSILRFSYSLLKKLYKPRERKVKEQVEVVKGAELSPNLCPKILLAVIN